MKRIAVLIIRAYQYLISPLMPRSCRFTPSCSEYAKEAVLKYGSVKGIWLSFKRVMKCHPFHPGGYDPVK